MTNVNSLLTNVIHSLKELHTSQQSGTPTHRVVSEHEEKVSVVYTDASTGRLIYPSYNKGGDRILDFSTAGYMEGQPLPVTEHLLHITVQKSDTNEEAVDDTDRIQHALNHVATLPIDAKSGLRGVVQLCEGTYHVRRPLELCVSGVILQGDKDMRTVVVHTGNAKHLLRVHGQPNELAKKRAPILDDQLPVGAIHLSVKHADRRYKPGDTVVVAVNFNTEWIKVMGMDVIHPKGDTTKNNGWKPGRFEHLRRVVRVQGDKVTLNGPLSTRLDQAFGGGYVELYSSHRVQHVGIQFLTLVDPRNSLRTKEEIMKDEKGKVKDYRFAAEMFDQILVDMDHAENCWMYQVKSVWWRNFIRLGTNTLAITLQNCIHTFPPGTPTSSTPAAPLVGQFAFEISGQHILISSCHAEHSFHAYSYKGRIPGPNVIHQSNAVGSLGDVGPHMKWSSGQLYDNCNIEGKLIIQDRFDAGSGHGWSAGNCVVWNTVAHGGMIVQRPPLGHNFLLGSSSKRAKARKDHPWAWEERADSKIHPASLYLAQLYERIP